MLAAFLTFDGATRAAVAPAAPRGAFDPVVAAQVALLAAAADFHRTLAGVQRAAAPGALVDLCPALAVDLTGVNSAYSRDCALTIDVAGDDGYTNNAGGGDVQGGFLSACGGDPLASVPAAAALDLSGNDAYQPTVAGVPRSCGVNGGGSSGAGLLFDAAGDDRYVAGSYGTNGGSDLGAGMLVDVLGFDSYSAGNSGTNGAGLRGTLIDVTGGDSYRAAGSDSNGGSDGVLVDADGWDYYQGENGAEGLLVDADGVERYLGANGGGNALMPGILLDGGGTGDLYADSTGSFTDRTVAPKGNGAQIDVAGVNPSVTLSPAFASDDCDTGGTNVVSGHVADAYVKLRTRPDPANPSAQWVCVAAEAAGAHAGGRLTVGGVGVALPAIDQDPASVAACATKPSNVRPHSGAVAGEQQWVDVTPGPAGTTDAAWVCVRLTNGVGFRLRYPGGVSTGVTIGFAADPAAPHSPPYPTAPWPAAGPSAACAVGGGTRYVNATVGDTPVALYGWSEGTRHHLCLRAGGAGGTGGRLTVDTDSIGGGPVAVGNDRTPCPVDVTTRDVAPTYGLYLSNPGTPLSACAQVGGAEVSVTVGGSGATSPTWTPDPA